MNISQKYKNMGKCLLSGLLGKNDQCVSSQTILTPFLVKKNLPEKACAAAGETRLWLIKCRNSACWELANFPPAAHAGYWQCWLKHGTCSRERRRQGSGWTSWRLHFCKRGREREVKKKRRKKWRRSLAGFQLPHAAPPAGIPKGPLSGKHHRDVTYLVPAAIAALGHHLPQKAVFAFFFAEQMLAWAVTAGTLLLSMTPSRWLT